MIIVFADLKKNFASRKRTIPIITTANRKVGKPPVWDIPNIAEKKSWNNWKRDWRVLIVLSNKIMTISIRIPKGDSAMLSLQPFFKAAPLLFI